MSLDRILVSIVSGAVALLGLTMASRAVDDAVYIAGFLFFVFGVLLIFRIIDGAFSDR